MNARREPLPSPIVYADVSGEHLLTKDNRFIPIDALRNEVELEHVLTHDLASSVDCESAISTARRFMDEGCFVLPVNVSVIRALVRAKERSS